MGAAVAVLIAWLGVRAVIRSTTGPVVPVVGPSPAVPGRVSPSPAAPRTTSPASPAPARSRPRPMQSARATSAAPGDSRSYKLTGGVVTLLVTGSACELISAAPAPGSTAQNWSSMGWLRVDFNRGGAEVSALICDWYQHAPTVTLGP